jgi:multidrug efflux pump
MGLTVNIVVLFSLILSVGMLVDGAIVVTEYADRRMREGAAKKQAYSEAAKRMTWPIIASTATTLAAFAPLLFWPGVPGQFMRYMPITLIGVLASSLVMALIFVPVLGSLIGKAAKIDKDQNASTTVNEQGYITSAHGFTGFYARILDKALRFPILTLLGAFGILIGAQISYAQFGKGVEFFPEIEPQYAVALIHARGNLSVYEKLDIVKNFEKTLYDIEGIKLLYTEAGKQQDSNDTAEDVIGKITIEMHEWGNRPDVKDILAQIRDIGKNFPGLYIETQKMQEGPPTGKAAQLELSSYDPERIEPMVDLVYEALNSIGDFRDFEDTRPLPGIEWEMKVDRAQASKFGVDLTTVGQYIRMITNGLKIADYRPNGSKDEIDIVIRHDDDKRTLDQLDRVRIQNDLGSIPISNFVTREAKPATGVINRVNQKRTITVKADLPPGMNVDAKITAIKEWLTKNKDRLDPLVDIKFKGQDEEQKESATFLQNAFMVALFIMGIILVTQFNSFYSAFLILSAVIMSTIGVMLGLLVLGQPFGIIMSGVGVIALAGIIVNNNIVLIDTFDHLHRVKGMSTRAAIMETGIQRLRPVLLTTVTTVLGLMPMVLQMNIDFINQDISVGAPSTQWWVQLATAIVFGLSFSTLLTLLVTPSALMLREKAGNLVKAIKTRIRKTKESLTKDS